MSNKKITINLSSEQLKALKIASNYLNISIVELIHEFINCLAYNGNGSDENMLISDWLEREKWNY